MNKVISSYFDDAHRGLQRQSSSFVAAPPLAASVQLPPLRPGSGPASLGASGDTGEKPAGISLQESKSMSFLDVSREQASLGVQAEDLQQALQNAAKLTRKNRALQDQLAIVSAKKEAFQAQAQRLEREFKRGREQTDALQKDLLEAKREAAEMGKEAQEAMTMMTEMRKSHIAEVRLLQRGLNARGNDEKNRNRVNEMADLVDKVGRAVVQRDEAIRDKTKMQAQFNKAINNLRAASDDCAKLKKRNKQLADGLKEARRKGQYAPPRPSVDPPEDSDEEFENELQALEKRFQILEEGPAGLDVLASNLSKDKQNLEKRVKSQEDAIRSLNSTIENWKLLGAQKDQQIKDLSAKLEKVMRDMAMMEEQIAQKQREIAEQVAQEKAALEARVSELEMECDNARAAADGMEKASTRLTRELVKVHEQYSGAPPPAAASAAPSSQSWKRVAGALDIEVKTGERLNLEVYEQGESVELRAREGNGEERRIPIGAGLRQELDEADPWNDLFNRAGVDPGPPRRIVISTKLGDKEVALKPSGTPVLLTAYRYSAQRFFVAGTELLSQKYLNITITEGSLTPELEKKIRTCDSDAALFDVLAAALRINTDGALALATRI